MWLHVTECRDSFGSPMRRSTLPSQYLQQMRDWHSLYEIGATTKEYEEQKPITILEDLKKLIWNVNAMNKIFMRIYKVCFMVSLDLI